MIWVAAGLSQVLVGECRGDLGRPLLDEISEDALLEFDERAG